MMHLKIFILYLTTSTTIYGYEFFNIDTGFRYLTKQLSTTDLSDYAPFTRWIEQKLDHFDTSEIRTWQMRYFERKDYWTPNGPIYLFIGGESTANPGVLFNGLMHDLARETNGAMFVSEHRYYGESQPVKRNCSEYNEDMKFLNVQQALADIAELLRYITKDKPKNKVVVVGGSYPGNLAAWMRLVYPDLVDAAIASSAPVLAKRNFYEYLEVVGKDYEKYGTPGCVQIIKNIFKRYDLLFETEEGVKKLRDNENISEHFNLTKDHKTWFISMKIRQFKDIAQYTSSHFCFKKHCLNLSKTGKIFFRTGYNKALSCYDFKPNEDLIETCNRQSWDYQTCTEFGYFQTTDSDDQPFPKIFPVEMEEKQCTELFGKSFDKNKVINGVKNINERYGGLTPNVTKVVFVNGELDPWSALGVLKNISYEAPAIFIPKSSHTKDLHSNKNGDPDELRRARNHIKYLIKKWIAFSD